MIINSSPPSPGHGQAIMPITPESDPQKVNDDDDRGTMISEDELIVDDVVIIVENAYSCFN